MFHILIKNTGEFILFNYSINSAIIARRQADAEIGKFMR